MNLQVKCRWREANARVCVLTESCINAC